VEEMELINTLIGISVPVTLIFGQTVERRHFRSIALREKNLSHMVVTDVKTFPGGADSSVPPILVIGEVFIATDYFKNMLAKIRNIFGGEVKSYQKLMIRARREAILRLLKEAHDKGYNAVCNLRLEFADVGGTASQTRGRGATMAGILASGTAYRLLQDVGK